MAKWLAALCIGFLTLATTYSLLVPFFEGPDAGAHFRYILYLHHQFQYPPLTVDTANFSHQLVQQPPLYYLLVRLLTSAELVEQAQQLELANPYYILGLSNRGSVSVEPETWQITIPIWTARAVSMLGGLLTAIGAYGLTLRLLGGPWLALAVASVATLNPQFLFSSASITNDTWTAALTVLSLWMAVRLHQSDMPAAAWIGVGALVGGASLSKYSGLLVMAPLALVVARVGFQHNWRRMALVAFYVVVGTGLVAGFWFGRNLLLWQTLTPTHSILSALPDLQRDTPASASELWQQARWLLHSYWGVFGYGALSQPYYYTLTHTLMLLAALGWILWPVRFARNHLGGIERRQFLFTCAIAIFWFGATFVALLNWMRLIHFADQGRLLFPAAPAIALLLVLGWQAWLPKQWHGWLHRTIPLLLLGMALSQIITLYSNYRVPAPLPEPIAYDRAVNARFQGGMTLLGVDFPEGAAITAQDELPVILYWTTSQPIDDFYSLFLHLTGEDDQLLYQFDGVPLQGRHPTAQWIPGEIFADAYDISVNAMEVESADGLATLSVGFYPIDDPTDRQSVLNDENVVVDDRVVLAQIGLHAQEGQDNPPAPPYPAQWENGIILAEAQISTKDDATPQQLALTWMSDAEIHQDYTVFVQVLDEANEIIAQIDRQPQSGQFPTSTWRTGDQIHDVYELAHEFDIEALSDWQRIIIGLYDEETGNRLLLQGETEPLDYFELVVRAK